MQLTPSGCPFIVRAIPQGHMVGGISLIWAIPVQYLGGKYTARSRSAELPYTGWAGFAQSYNSPQQFRRLVKLAAQHNLRVNTIVADCLDEVLEVFQQLHQQIPINDKRCILSHVVETSPEQLRVIRAQRNGLRGSCYEVRENRPACRSTTGRPGERRSETWELRR